MVAGFVTVGPSEAGSSKSLFFEGSKHPETVGQTSPSLRLVIKAMRM
jgi:hypothetical protein